MHSSLRNTAAEIVVAEWHKWFELFLIGIFWEFTYHIVLEDFTHNRFIVIYIIVYDENKNELTFKCIDKIYFFIFGPDFSEINIQIS